MNSATVEREPEARDGEFWPWPGLIVLGLALLHAATRLRDLDSEIALSFPAYSEFLKPHPTSLASLQRPLAPDEAVIMALVAEDAVVLWTITAGATQVQAVPVSRTEVGNLVQRVRASVDLEAASRRGSLPTFDREAARRLYQIVIEPGQSLLVGKQHIIFIPDGALQTIPLHILIGGEPEDWLVRRFAVTVAPSPAALVAQRESMRPSRAEFEFLGVGDPRFRAFNGIQSHGLRGISVILRQSLAGLPLLPETRDELQQMAGNFPAGDTALLLGENATKPTVAHNHPDRFRVLVFSTHALMAGQLPGLPEPAIVLTPDGGRSDEWDGLLMASDVASMNIDADLVILSACNTAAPDGGPFADGFSGLARAFLHAGARSLLVSNWSVASKATVELTTSFVRAIREAPRVRRADALRTSILKMLDGDDRTFTHPGFWAPFVVVGE